MDKLIRYEMEQCSILQSLGYSRDVWFLDAIQTTDDGRLTRTNIVNGDYDYCLREKARLVALHNRNA